MIYLAIRHDYLKSLLDLSRLEHNLLHLNRHKVLALDSRFFPRDTFYLGDRVDSARDLAIASILSHKFDVGNLILAPHIDLCLLEADIAWLVFIQYPYSASCIVAL